MPGGARPKTRQMHETEVKRRDALELHIRKLSYAEIGKALGVGRSRAHALVREALREVREERLELAEYALDEELRLIALTIRQSAEIAVKPCPVCDGNGVKKMERCEDCHGEGEIGPSVDRQMCDVCRGKGVIGEFCETCTRTGFFYEPDVRMRAIDRVGREADRRAKLLGLYAPSRVELPFDRDFYGELATLPEEELDKQLEAFMLGVATAQETQEKVED